jgi:hypothetical protein
LERRRRAFLLFIHSAHPCSSPIATRLPTSSRLPGIFMPSKIFFLYCHHGAWNTVGLDRLADSTAMACSPRRSDSDHVAMLVSCGIASVILVPSIPSRGHHPSSSPQHERRSGLRKSPIQCLKSLEKPTTKPTSDRDQRLRPKKRAPPTLNGEISLP